MCLNVCICVFLCDWVFVCVVVLCLDKHLILRVRVFVFSCFCAGVCLVCCVVACLCLCVFDV